MTRALVAAGLLTMLGSMLGACGDGMDQQTGTAPDCSQYKTCSDCTWVVGCGFCFNGNGNEGMCLSGPEQCKAPGTKWNWDPIGCHTPADASGD